MHHKGHYQILCWFKIAHPISLSMYVPTIQDDAINAKKLGVKYWMTTFLHTEGAKLVQVPRATSFTNKDQ
jgi:hypothetical protein